MEYEGISVAFIKEYEESFVNTVIALANTNGGVIYLGVNKDWDVIGVDFPEEQLESSLQAISELICPGLGEFVKGEIKTEDTPEGDKEIIAFHVQKGISCPYYLKNKGMRPEGVFLRHDQYTVPASEADILRMITETGGGAYEDLRTINQQLTFEAMAKEQERISLGIGRDEMLMMHILRPDGTYSILGELMSDQCTRIFKGAVFEGTGKSVFLEKCEFTGSLISQYRATYEFIRRHSDDWRRFPELAVREALINSVVHRDYSFTGSSLINIYSDRLEIISYGGLVEGVSMDDVHLGVSIHRNMSLTGIFRRYGLVDSHGTGISKIMESYEGCEIQPTIDVTLNVFRYILPVLTKTKTEQSAIAPLSESERSAMKLFTPGKYLVRSDIEDNLKLSQTASIELLKKLLNKGLIVKTGSGKKTEYSAVSSLHED